MRTECMKVHAVTLFQSRCAAALLCLLRFAYKAGEDSIFDCIFSCEQKNVLVISTGKPNENNKLFISVFTNSENNLS